MAYKPYSQQPVLRGYATGDVMADHARRGSHGDCPLLHMFLAMHMDERWVRWPPETMLDMFRWFRGEGVNFLVEDLLRLPCEPGVIAEGFRLLPRLVESPLPAPGQAVWLLPTADFRLAVFEGRGGAAWGLARTTDPKRAHNLLERYQMFTDVLREETTRLGQGRHGDDRGRSRRAGSVRVRTLSCVGPRPSLVPSSRI